VRESGQEPKTKVFISYSRKDIAFADRLDATLWARGFEPLIDRTDIYAFEEWWKRVEDLITCADTVVFVLSPDAVKPDTVALKEVAFAASLNKRFAPIVRPVEDKSVPQQLARLNFIFFDDPAQFEQSADKLAEALSDDPRTRVGLPEIKVGLFPGAGGTTRIARILPPADALQYLLKGDLLHTDRAQKMKLIDAVVPAADLIKTAKDRIKAGGNAKKPWDMDNFRLPGGPVYSKAGMMTFPAANAIYRRETYDNYPAARAIMQVVYEGLLVPFDHALRIEQRWFAKIVRSPQAAAMTRSLVVSLQELNKGARRPAQVPLSRVKRVGIIGAGFMGAGIGYVTAHPRGCDVAASLIGLCRGTERTRYSATSTIFRSESIFARSSTMHCMIPIF
jgi:enoyl-CoA hydratase/carnithine racemase